MYLMNWKQSITHLITITLVLGGFSVISYVFFDMPNPCPIRKTIQVYVQKQDDIYVYRSTDAMWILSRNMLANGTTVCLPQK